MFAIHFRFIHVGIIGLCKLNSLATYCFVTVYHLEKENLIGIISKLKDILCLQWWKMRNNLSTWIADYLWNRIICFCWKLKYQHIETMKHCHFPFNNKIISDIFNNLLFFNLPSNENNRISIVKMARNIVFLLLLNSIFKFAQMPEIFWEMRLWK